MSHAPPGLPGNTQAAEASTTAHSRASTFPMQHGHRPAGIRGYSGHARAPAGMALPPPLLPGRSRQARIDLQRAPPAGPR